MINFKWREFIQDNFQIKTKEGYIVPFIFNEVQNQFYDYLINKYGQSLQGVRENIVKGRQQGFSSLIDGLKTAMFLVSNKEGLPVFGSQIISHKDKETKPLFDRVNLFVDSYLDKRKIDRKKFLAIDNKTSYMETYKGSNIFVGTAGAKTLGRGGTLQSIHWSECAFYPDTPILNAGQLVLGAEQQIKDGVGMIFRESTGNRVGDFMYSEFFKGKEGVGSFGSVFVEWFKTREYVKEVPQGYEFNNDILSKVGYTYDILKNDFHLGDDQIYWWIKKLESAEDPKLGLREYPMIVEDAFLASGDYYFDSTALKEAKARVKEPIKTFVYIHEL